MMPSPQCFPYHRVRLLATKAHTSGTSTKTTTAPCISSDGDNRIVRQHPPNDVVVRICRKHDDDQAQQLNRDGTNHQSPKQNPTLTSNIHATGAICENPEGGVQLRRERRAAKAKGRIAGGGRVKCLTNGSTHPLSPLYPELPTPTRRVMTPSVPTKRTTCLRQGKHALHCTRRQQAAASSP